MILSIFIVVIMIYLVLSVCTSIALILIDYRNWFTYIFLGFIWPYVLFEHKLRKNPYD